MILIQGLWVLLMIVFFFTKIRIGLCIYAAYIILVPYMNIHLGITFQWNLVNTLLLIAFALDFSKHKNLKFNMGVLSPFVVLYVCLFCEIPFQNDVPWEFSLNQFRIGMMEDLILPAVILNVARYDEHLVRYIRNTVLVCMVIAMGYGLFIAYIGGGVNPYMLLVQTANGVEFDDGYIAVGNGRMFGRISSVFTHPMTYGMFMSLAVVYVYSQKKNLSKRMLWLLLCLSVAAILLCGIRTPIGAVFVAIGVYLLLNMKYKMFFQAAIVLLAVYTIVQFFPELNSYVSSIFEKKSNDVSGSSIEMRLEQLQGCFDEIKSSPIFGKGYGWVTYYHQLKGDHPVILSFESLLFVVLCNYGFLGLLIWILVFIRVIKKCFKSNITKEKSVMLVVLTATYLAYSLITGEYGYMKFYLIFFVLIFVDSTNGVLTIKKKKNESKSYSVLSSPISSF